MKRKFVGFACAIIYVVVVVLTFGVLSGLSTTVASLAKVGIEISTLMLFHNMLIVAGILEIILAIILAIIFAKYVCSK